MDSKLYGHYHDLFKNPFRYKEDILPGLVDIQGISMQKVSSMEDPELPGHTINLFAFKIIGSSQKGIFKKSTQVSQVNFITSSQGDSIFEVIHSSTLGNTVPEGQKYSIIETQIPMNHGVLAVNIGVNKGGQLVGSDHAVKTYNKDITYSTFLGCNVNTSTPDAIIIKSNLGYLKNNESVVFKTLQSNQLIKIITSSGSFIGANNEYKGEDSTIAIKEFNIATPLNSLFQYEKMQDLPLDMYAKINNKKSVFGQKARNEQSTTDKDRGSQLSYNFLVGSRKNNLEGDAGANALQKHGFEYDYEPVGDRIDFKSRAYFGYIPTFILGGETFTDNSGNINNTTMPTHHIQIARDGVCYDDQPTIQLHKGQKVFLATLFPNAMNLRNFNTNTESPDHPIDNFLLGNYTFDGGPNDVYNIVRNNYYKAYGSGQSASNPSILGLYARKLSDIYSISPGKLEGNNDYTYNLYELTNSSVEPIMHNINRIHYESPLTQNIPSVEKYNLEIELNKLPICIKNIYDEVWRKPESIEYNGSKLIFKKETIRKEGKHAKMIIGHEIRGASFTDFQVDLTLHLNGPTLKCLSKEEEEREETEEKTPPVELGADQIHYEVSTKTKNQATINRTIKSSQGGLLPNHISLLRHGPVDKKLGHPYNTKDVFGLRLEDSTTLGIGLSQVSTSRNDYAGGVSHPENNLVYALLIIDKDNWNMIPDLPKLNDITFRTEGSKLIVDNNNQVDVVLQALDEKGQAVDGITKNSLLASKNDPDIVGDNALGPGPFDNQSLMVITKDKLLRQVSLPTSPYIRAREFKNQRHQPSDGVLLDPSVVLPKDHEQYDYYSITFHDYNCKSLFLEVDYQNDNHGEAVPDILGDEATPHTYTDSYLLKSNVSNYPSFRYRFVLPDGKTLYSANKKFFFVLTPEIRAIELNSYFDIFITNNNNQSVEVEYKFADEKDDQAKSLLATIQPSETYENIDFSIFEARPYFRFKMNDLYSEGIGF